MRLLCAAENFAYGPAGKLLTVAGHLRARGHELIFVGTGTAFDLASKSSAFAAVVHADTDAASFALEHEVLIRGADVVVSAMDRGAIVAAAAAGTPAVWIDSLFYWWEELPDAVLGADLFIKQDVLPDENGMERFASQIRDLRSVGPIVDRPARALVRTEAEERTRRLLISYGGMDAPGWYEAGKNHHYPEVVTRLILDAVEHGAHDEVLFTGSSHIMAGLRSSFAAPGVEFRSLDHDDFVDALRRSDVALLPGGMETTLEAFANEVPTIFLPPLNVTHHLHATAFRRLGFAQMSIGLDAYLEMPDWDGMSRREKVDSFMVLARRWQGDDEITSDMAQRIGRWLGDAEGLRAQADAQRAFFASLATDGASETADLIEGLACSDSAAPSVIGAAT